MVLKFLVSLTSYHFPCLSSLHHPQFAVLLLDQDAKLLLKLNKVLVHPIAS